MTDRERWTVYPLLFLALGIALRSKVTSSLDLKSISCEELTIRQPDGSPRMRLQYAPDRSGANAQPRLVVISPDGKAVAALGADVATHGGAVYLFSKDGTPQVRIQAGDKGGEIELRTKGGQWRAVPATE